MSENEYQDWEPVVIHGKQSNNNTIERKKFQPSQISKMEKAINDDSYTPPKPSIEFKKEFQKARIVKKFSQADLAKSLNIKQSVINEYESGKKVPDNLTIAKLEKKLGVKLPRNKKK